VDPGYLRENVLVLRVDLPQSRYPSRAQRVAAIGELLERYGSAPGVVSVGAVNSLPLSNVHFGAVYRLHAAEGTDDNHRAALCFASPDYLRTMGTILLRGRFLEEQDLTDPPRVVVINQKLANEHWRGGNPLGERMIHLSQGEELVLEIVGVVGSVRRRSLDDEAEPAMYVPWLPTRSASFVVRTENDPSPIVRTLRHETAMVDPRLPTYGVATLEERLDRAVTPNRFRTVLMTLFAAVALALALVGVYGVLSYSVASRRHEMGVRMALGARRTDVVGLVLRQSLGLVSIGTLVGISFAYILTRTMSSLLFGISPRDPWIYAASSIALILVALGASWLPAHQAASVDPNVALRSL